MKAYCLSLHITFISMAKSWFVMGKVEDNWFKYLFIKQFYNGCNYGN